MTSKVVISRHVATLRRKASLDTCIDSLRELERLVDDDNPNHAQNIDAIFQAGVVAAIVGAMNAFPNYENLQCLACSLLERLVKLMVEVDDSFFRIHADNIVSKAIYQAGGVAAVVGAMKTFPTYFNLQSAACRLLVCLTDDVLFDDQILALVRAGSVDAVVAAMRAHPNESDIQSAGCQALGHLAIFLNYEPVILAGEGFRVIMRAMHNEQLDHRPMVRAEACSALALTFCNGDDDETFERLNVVFTILDAMRDHPNDAYLQRRGCEALDCLATERSKVVVVAIVDAMRDQKNEADLQRVACDALKYLAKAHGEEIVASGGVVAVVGAMGAHPNDADLQRRACESLECLAEVHGDEIVESGGVVAAVGAIKKHLTEVDVQFSASKLLQMLATP